MEENWQSGVPEGREKGKGWCHLAFVSPAPLRGVGVQQVAPFQDWGAEVNSGASGERCGGCRQRPAIVQDKHGARVTAGAFFDCLLERLKVISSCDPVSAYGVGCAINTVNKECYLHQVFL